MKAGWIVLLLFLLALFAANHVAPIVAGSSAPAPDAGTAHIPLRSDRGGDHLLIAIDEDALASRTKEATLRYDRLEGWSPDPVEPTPPPDAIKRLVGKRVAVAGFMSLTREARRVGTFALVKGVHPGTRAFERRHTPEPNEHVRVEMKEPVEVANARPVLVRGTFRILPDAGSGSVYVVEGDSFETAARSEGGGLPRSDDLPRFDFFWLEDLAFQEARGLPFEYPEAMTALEGKRVVAEGFYSDRTEEPALSFILSRKAWDGCCGGEPPTYFDSLLVLPAPGSALPAPWEERGAWAGVLEINRDEKTWPDRGIVRLERAGAVRPPGSDPGPWVPLWAEAIVFALAALGAALWGRKGEADTGNGKWEMEKGKSEIGRKDPEI